MTSRCRKKPMWYLPEHSLLSSHYILYNLICKARNLLSSPTIISIYSNQLLLIELVFELFLMNYLSSECIFRLAKCIINRSSDSAQEKRVGSYEPSRPLTIANISKEYFGITSFMVIEAISIKDLFNTLFNVHYIIWLLHSRIYFWKLRWTYDGLYKLERHVF